MSNPGTDHSHFPNYHGTMTGGNQSYSIQSTTENSGKLKVEDALKYIDRVKGRFNEEIYKKFLEVMKDFKAQKINTETVIQNVLTLFHGHQDLIEGFNTFLPPGYQMSTYQSTPLTVPTIESPLTLYPESNILHVSSATSLNIINNSPSVNTSNTNQPYTIYSNAVVNPPIDMSASSETSHTGLAPLDIENRSETGSAPIIQTGNTILNLKSIPPGIPQTQTPSEFNHAVEYVNKIKNRFQKQPDVYKRFLEILHWYQKEQKNPDLVKRKQTETEVSQEVAKLFDNEQDLLQEFSTFLPDSNDNDLVTSRRPSGYKSASGATQSYYINSINSSNVIAVSEKSKLQNVNISKIDNPMASTNEKDIIDYYRPGSTPAPSNITTSSQTTKRNLVQDLNNDRRMNSTSTHPPSKRLRTAASSISNKDTIKINLLNNHELLKFRHFEVISVMCQELLDLPSETSYYSFINTIDLFNRHIMNVDQLKSAVKPLFSKRSEVWQNFVNLLEKISDNDNVYSVDLNRDSNYLYDAGNVNSPSNVNSNVKECDSGLNLTNNNPQNINMNFTGTNSLISKNTFWRKNIDLNKLEKCGSHYRILPEEYIEPLSIAQSKSKICRQVLNYNFICHRSLSTEDTPFVFSKKSPYEESVFKIEDERYEIDMVMEMNKAAMIRLADMQIRLKEMTPEEINEFNFEENLYRSSSILFYKAIQRIYGDKAADIINGLKNHPAVVVPIVLERLKEKDVEWKEKIKQFRRHWRDQDLYLLKSLDYQASNFRAKDASMTRPKFLLTQLDAIVKIRQLHLNNYQEIIPITCLVESLLHIKRTWKIEKPEKWCSHAYGCGGVLEYSNKLSPSPDYHMLLLFPCDSQYAKSILEYPFQQKMYLFDTLDWYDLLSDAASLVIHHLKRQSNFSKEDKTNMKLLMRITLQDIFIDERFLVSDDEEESLNGNAFQSEHSASRSKSNVNKENHYKLFLGNKQWYVFIRLYHTLLDRLASLKVKAEQLVSKHKEEKKQNIKEVADLLLYKKSNQLNPEDYYQEAINLVKDLLDSCEDTANFEDKMREMLGIHAYIWFSMDKLITTLVKQLQIISCTDSFSRKLSSLFRQCSKSFYGEDDHENKLKINITGTGTHINARTDEIIKDEFAYMQAASRLSFHYNEPLVMLIFQRNPPTKCSGHMSITLLDVSPRINSGSESQEDIANNKNESTTGATATITTTSTTNNTAIVNVSKTEALTTNVRLSVMTWRHYMERYVNCSEKLGFSDGLHNIGLKKKISVPVFLLRSVRKSISFISCLNNAHSDEALEKCEDSSTNLSSKNSSTITDWHGSVVQLTCNIFDGANEKRLHKFLKNTIMTGHMCPVAEEGHNLMVQYETTKLSWSVGSCGVFYRLHKSDIKEKSRSEYVAKIRKDRFLKFQNLWLSQQS